MTRDSIFKDHAEAKEAEFHRIMVKAGLRPEASRVEDFRPKRAEVVAEVEPGLPVRMRDGELSE